MAFVVSDRIKRVVRELINLSEVQEGLDFIKKDESLQIKQQCELAAIEAPTGDELDRAKWMVEQFIALGLEDCHVDPYCNAVGLRKGKVGNRRIVVEAHLDTVFPRGSVTKVPIVEDGVISCPGIGDNTRGCISVLGAIRTLNALKIETNSDIVFMGTAREEGVGGFGGIHDFMKDNNDIAAYLCIDGDGVGGIVYQATGIKTCEVNFYAHGGHASSGFGKYANPLTAAARAAVKISNLKVPTNPRTTFCVSNFHSGNDAGIHAIPSVATIKYNIRSNSQQELENLDHRIKVILAEACQEETAYWNMDRVTFDQKYYVDVPAGSLNEHDPIVEAAYETIRFFGVEPEFIVGGATNASRPIYAGIPAVCLGIGRRDSNSRMQGIHSLHESFRVEGAYIGIQHTFLMTLSLSGVYGRIDSILG